MGASGVGRQVTDLGVLLVATTGDPGGCTNLQSHCGVRFASCLKLPWLLSPGG